MTGEAYGRTVLAAEAAKVRAAGEAYGRTALADELAKVRDAREGGRNTTLNTAWFKCCQLINAGQLDRDFAYERMRQAALDAGLPPAEVAATMASAERGAAGKPRTSVPPPTSLPHGANNGPPLHQPGRAADPTPGPDVAPTLEFVTLAELRARVAAAGPRRWLFRGLWPAGDYGVHAAEMKGQKTWNAVDAAVSAASGTSWLGAVPVDAPGPVIMFHGEGSEANLVRRIDAVCASRDLDPDTLPVHVCTRAPKLNVDLHVAVMTAKVAEVEPVLVVLDPFYLSARGANTRDLVEMGGLLERVQHLCQDRGAALFVVTHHNRNAAASGALRITGAGPAEWGRVLITAEVKSRRTDPDTAETTVVTELEVIGGEVAGGRWRVTRRVRADDPDDLNSPLHYQVTAREREPDDDDGDDDTPPTRRKILAALRAAAGPRTIRQIQDWIAENDPLGDGIVPRRETCSRDLNALARAGLADAVDEKGVKAWFAVQKDP